MIKPPEELMRRVCVTVDGYVAEHPNVQVIEVLSCLEALRHLLTEAMLKLEGRK